MRSGRHPSRLAAALGPLPKPPGTPPLDLNSADLLLDLGLNFDEHGTGDIVPEVGTEGRIGAGERFRAHATPWADGCMKAAGPAD